jgi:hypothetical protein
MIYQMVLHRPVELAGDIGNFDSGNAMLTPQTNFYFSELDFHLRRLRTPQVLRLRPG